MATKVRKPGGQKRLPRNVTKTIVTLTNEQVKFLDGLSASIRDRHDVSIDRSIIIRQALDQFKKNVGTKDALAIDWCRLKKPYLY